MNGFSSRTIPAGIASPASEDRLGIAGHVHHTRLWPYREDALGDLLAQHVGHDHVGDEQVDRPVVVARERDRLVPVCRAQDAVAMALQDPARHLADAVLVLDQEHDLPAPSSLLGHGAGAALAGSKVAGSMMLHVVPTPASE